MTHRIIFRGGLGNQMFQYALLLALRKRGFLVSIDTTTYDYVKMHNGYELKRVFGISDVCHVSKGLCRFIQRAVLKFKPLDMVTEDISQYNPEIFNTTSRYITGWWQDARYFADIEDEIRRVFEFKNLNEDVLKTAAEMHSNNSVSLHLRRGDYAEFGMMLLGDEYYRKAVDYINSSVKSPIFYIFSDDKDEAIKLAERLGINYKVITGNVGKISYYDMYLMSQCSHNIIANSSFSWWGAWLNANPGKIVICPKIWIPKSPNFKPQLNEWIKL